MGRMLYADDLAVVVDSEWEMQEVLGEWEEAFGKHGLKNLDASKVNDWS